jgi:dihydroorotate dehydrogenase (NAD+) catalytic subunit
VESPSGLVSDSEWQNPGLQAFLASELPPLAKRHVRTIVSIAARTPAEYAELARRAGSGPGVVGVEVSLLGGDPLTAGRTLSVVSREVPAGVVVLAKIDLGSRPLDVAREALRNGADALVVGYPPRALAVDPETLQPRVRGHLSGPAVRPVILDIVADLYAALPGVPLVGCGGITSGDDALAMLAAGASAVQVGTALLRDPSAPCRILEQLGDRLTRHGLAVKDVVGVTHRGGLV